VVARSENQRAIKIDGGFGAVVFRPFNVILPKEVESETILFRIEDPQQLGPKGDPEGGRNPAFEQAELNPLAKTLASLGHPPQSASTGEIQGVDVVRHKHNHCQPRG
jgi:hypothetical protein